MTNPVVTVIVNQALQIPKLVSRWKLGLDIQGGDPAGIMDVLKTPFMRGDIDKPVHGWEGSTLKGPELMLTTMRIPGLYAKVSPVPGVSCLVQNSPSLPVSDAVVGNLVIVADPDDPPMLGTRVLAGILVRLNNYRGTLGRTSVLDIEYGPGVIVSEDERLAVLNLLRKPKLWASQSGA